MKVRRAKYVAMLWARASEANPNHGLCPSQYGWEKIDNNWSPIWYQVLPLPEKLVESAIAEGEDGEIGDSGDEDSEWSEGSDEE